MDDLDEMVKMVVTSEEHANFIVDIIERLQTSDNDDSIKSCVAGLCDIFRHYLSCHFDWFYPEISCDDQSTDVTLDFQLWIRSKYSATLHEILGLLHHRNIQIFILDSVMKLLQWEGQCHQKATPLNVYNYNNNMYMRLVFAMLSSEHDSGDLIGRLVCDYLTYRDVKYFTLQNINTVINSKLDYKKLEDVNGIFISNAYCLMSQVVMETDKKPLPLIYFVGDPSNQSRQQAQNVCSLGKLKNAFTNCWLAFLQLKLPPLVHKKVLVSLHLSVMPHMTKPQLLVDFLVGSYDQRGIYSILALNGLFVLMHHYHLDYPNFYTNLYTLLQPSIFHVKYMSRFFKLLNVFLSSSHLPLYLVAAFAKRLSHLALTAPPQGVMIAGVMVTNLIKRHPNCRVLLNRSTSEYNEVDSDPFIVESDDPQTCNALDSCLWELKTLSNHYHPLVSDLINRLLDPEKQLEEEDLHVYLNLSAKEMLEKENEVTENVSVNFISPTGLWESWT